MTPAKQEVNSLNLASAPHAGCSCSLDIFGDLWSHAIPFKHHELCYNMDTIWQQIENVNILHQKKSIHDGCVLTPGQNLVHAPWRSLEPEKFRKVPFLLFFACVLQFLFCTCSNSADSAHCQEAERCPVSFAASELWRSFRGSGQW